jgi:hypothetical protein
MDGYRESVELIKKDLESAAIHGSHIFKVPETVFRKALKRNVANWEMDARVDMPGLLNCLKIQEALGAVSTGMQPADMVSQL